MIEQLVNKVFLTRGLTHLSHWHTHSYAVHMALDEFYNDVVDAIDSLVESYQGLYGLIELEELDGGKCPKDIIKHLSDELTWINNNSVEITNDIAALDNILQELQHVYMKVLYKLKNLS